MDYGFIFVLLRWYFKYMLILTFFPLCFGTKDLQTKIYYLTRDCQPVTSKQTLAVETMNSDGHVSAISFDGGISATHEHGAISETKRLRKHTLRLEIGGAVIYSHRSNVEAYPENFHCFVVAHAVDSPKIHVHFRSLSVPDYEADLVTGGGAGCANAIWCYDSNTPYTTAMSQANGQAGLCKNHIPAPFFTKKQYFSFIFMTKTVKPQDRKMAGFEVVLTAVRQPVLPDSGVVGGGARGDDDVQLATKSCSTTTTPELIFLCVDKHFCLSDALRCDGVPNCLDGSDEDPVHAKCDTKESFMNKFLSLGLTASIAIAAGAVVFVLICMATTTCFCYRLVKKPTTNDAILPQDVVLITASESIRGGGSVTGTPQSVRLIKGDDGAKTHLLDDHSGGSTAACSVYLPSNKESSPRLNRNYKALAGNASGIAGAARHAASDYAYSYSDSVHSSSSGGGGAPPYPLTTHAHLYNYQQSSVHHYHPLLHIQQQIHPLYKQSFRGGDGACDSLLNGSIPNSTCLTPTSSRSAKSGRSGRAVSMVTYSHARERVKFPVQL